MERQAYMASLQGTIMAASASFPCLTQLIMLLTCTWYLCINSHLHQVFLMQTGKKNLQFEYSTLTNFVKTGNIFFVAFSALLTASGVLVFRISHFSQLKAQI